MPLSFPAYYEEEVPVDQDKSRVLNIVKEVLFCLHWKVVEEIEDEIVAKSSVGFRSWGEKICIKVEDTQLRVISKCVLSTQCFDWGKNKSNVKLFIQGYNLFSRNR